MTANSIGIGSAGSTGNFANYNSGSVTTVGTNGGPSAYEAFDMSGNVYEWNDLTGSLGSSRGLRSGYWDSFFAIDVSSTVRDAIVPSIEDVNIGFRLASPVAVPEPSTYAMALAGLACGGWQMFRRRRARS